MSSDDLLYSALSDLPARKAVALAARLQDATLKKLTNSVDKFSDRSSRQTRWLIGLTWALLGATIALIWLTAKMYLVPAP